MVRAVRRTGLVLALPALVGLSTLAHWLAGQRLHGLWIMPDEAIYAARAVDPVAGRAVAAPARRRLGLRTAVSAARRPAVVGRELRTRLRLAQTAAGARHVAVRGAGLPLRPSPHATAATPCSPPRLTVSSPLLLYSGLVMTEVLFYPLSAFALLAVARAVETAAKRDQVIALVLIGLAIATRVQAVVFLGVFAAAVGVDALFARTTRRLRAFWPMWRRARRGRRGAAAAPGVFGAYSGTLHGSYPIGASLRLSYYHFAYVMLMVAVVPAAAAAVLFVEAARGRLRDPATRALLGVTGCAAVLVCAQVGFFSARYAPHLLGRNLALPAAAPLPALRGLACSRRSPPPRHRRGNRRAVARDHRLRALEQPDRRKGPAGLVRFRARPVGPLDSGRHRRGRCSSRPADLRHASPPAHGRSAGAGALRAHRVVGPCIQPDRRADARGPERAGRDAAPLGRPRATEPVAYLYNDAGYGTSSGSSGSGTTASTTSSRSRRRRCLGR